MQKFNMGQAWDDAMAILRGNMNLLAVIAGLFVFLPNLALYMFAPEVAAGPVMEGNESPEAMTEIFSGYYGAALPWILAIGVIGLVGSLSMYALVADNRPTVGEALKTGLGAIIPAFVAQILLGVLVGVLGGVLIGLPFAIGLPALAVLTGLIFLVAMIYLIVKFSLISPVVVLDGIKNPITILQRSWALTKGNSVRLFGYYLILIICVGVIAAVFGIVTGLLVALFGDSTVGLMLSGILNGALAAVFAVLGVGVISAVYRQLAGDTPAKIGETFE